MWHFGWVKGGHVNHTNWKHARVLLLSTHWVDQMNQPTVSLGETFQWVYLEKILRAQHERENRDLGHDVPRWAGNTTFATLQPSFLLPLCTSEFCKCSQRHVFHHDEQLEKPGLSNQYSHLFYARKYYACHVVKGRGKMAKRSSSE